MQDSKNQRKPPNHSKYIWVSDQIEAYFKRRGYWPDVQYVQQLIGFKNKKSTLRFIRGGVTKGYFELSGNIVNNGELQVCESCEGRGFVKR